MLEASIAWLLAYKYLLLFPFAFVEGPIITIIAGSLAASGQIDFLLALVIILVADEAADTMYYFFGRFGRDRFLKRWGKYIGLGEKTMRRVDKHFLEHAGKTLIFGKLAFSFEIPFIVTAGIARYPYGKFILYMIIAAIPKSLGLMLIGYFFGFTIVNAQHSLLLASRFAFAGITVVALILLVRYVTKHHIHILPWKTHPTHNRQSPKRST